MYKTSEPDVLAILQMFEYHLFNREGIEVSLDISNKTNMAGVGST